MTAEPTPQELPHPLKPHQYPAWIWLAAVALIGALGIALYELPPYYRAATLLRRGEAAVSRKNHIEAIKILEESLRLVPDSKKTRIALAIAYFSGPAETQEKGLEALGDVTLGEEEWKDVSAVMPEKFQSLFTTK